jgi:post-segregation antitoxin (ccd killing protein)
MSEALENSYRSLEVSALANEGMASEARRQAEGLIKYAERCEAQAQELRLELGRVSQLLNQGE